MSILPNETQIMNALLDGNDPVLEILRQQFDSSEVNSREFTGVGSFTYFKVSENSPRVDPSSFFISDVHLEIEGTENGASAMLFVRNGVIDFLEVIAVTGKLPEDYIINSVNYLTRKKVDSFHELIPSMERDLEVTRRAWLKDVSE